MPLHADRTSRYLRISLAAALTLGVGSALGVEAAAEALSAPWGSGYIAEVGLTGLATAAITYRAHLAEHRGALVKGSWQSWSLWSAMTVPLLVSVACNLGTANVVGAACAFFAVAWSLLSCVIADRSSTAMQARAREVSNQDEQEIRQVAMGEDLFTAVDAEPGEPEAVRPGAETLLTKAELQAAVLEDLIAAFTVGKEPGEDSPDTEPPAAPQRPELFSDEALARWLSEPPAAGGQVSASPSPNHDGPQGAAKAVPAGEEPIHPRGQIDGEQRGEDTGGVALPPGVESAAAARRATGEATRARITAYMADHPQATRAEIASALGLHPDTVKRYRRDIRRTTRQDAD